MVPMWERYVSKLGRTQAEPNGVWCAKEQTDMDRVSYVSATALASCALILDAVDCLIRTSHSPSLSLSQETFSCHVPSLHI